jgi:CubicO group peptidase (beta-lactamase class C family)
MMTHDLNRGLAIFAVVLLLAACGDERDTTRADAPTTQASKAPSSTATPELDPTIAAQSQNVLDGAAEADKPGCSAAVGIEGHVAWTGVRGIADLQTGAEITKDTAFDIASVSKQFTATAILLLADDGTLSLDDTLASHVPGLPEWAETVNLAQLMHQTSGIPDYIGLLEDEGYAYSDRTTQDQALQVLAKVPELQFEPGAQFDYSNSNYLLLADVVQRVSGQSLPDFLSAQVFKPLDLAMVVNATQGIPGAALPYDFDEGTGEYTVAVSAWEQIGDGAIQTTPSQLVRWADNYRTGKVGGPKLLEAQLAGAVQTDPGGDDRYGAGIYILGDGQLSHDGSWSGSVTAFHVSEDRRTSIAISCNTGDQDPEAIAEELAKFWL